MRQSNVSDRQLTIDVILFGDYADALADDNVDLAGFLRQRFPDRLDTATDAWLATDPLVSPDAPASPFDMAEYRLDSSDRASELEASADRHSRQARQANQRSDNYTITSVFFATAIPLAALSSRTSRASLQVGLLVAAAVVFVATAAVVATFPIEI